MAKLARPCEAIATSDANGSAGAWTLLLRAGSLKGSAAFLKRARVGRSAIAYLCDRCVASTDDVAGRDGTRAANTAMKLLSI